LIDLKEIKNKIIKKENFYFLAIILFIFGIDRLSKIEIIKNFSDGSVYLNDFLNLDLVWNTGIGFGLLSSNSTIFYNSISLLIGVIILFLLFLIISANNFDKFVFSLITGGAIGNFYDRIYFQAVPDFIDLHFENLHWFTFNLADIFITVGIIIYICKGFTEKNV
tara:strand:- start:449 stop:943 length:495 start_codon:yes stop_codon:yes gene_type:complete